MGGGVGDRAGAGVHLGHTVPGAIRLNLRPLVAVSDGLVAEPPDS
jgi:hypothetical protein